MNVQGLIFDMDGTLLDSMEVWDAAGETYLHSKGITDIPQNLGDILNPFTMRETAEYLIRNFGLKLPEDLVIEEINRQIEDEYRLRIQLKTGVADFLERYKKIPMCIATATDEPLARAAVNRLGITPYFSFIITTTEVGAGKLRPDIFLEAAKRLGCAVENAVVFEDAPHAIETAKKAGFYTVALREPVFAAQEDFAKKTADKFIDSLAGFSLA